MEALDVVTLRDRREVFGRFDQKPHAKLLGLTQLNARPYKRALRKRRALAITETDDRLIAAAAMMGLRRSPKNG